jgi:ATP-dependent metalloprotease
MTTVPRRLVSSLLHRSSSSSLMRNGISSRVILPSSSTSILLRLLAINRGRCANFFTLSSSGGIQRPHIDADTMRRHEQNANRYPGNAQMQQTYLQSLAANRMNDEILNRVESGKFAVSPMILELYLRGLTETRRVRESDASDIRARLRDLWASHSGSSSVFIPSDALRNAKEGKMSNGWGGGNNADIAYFGSSMQNPTYNNSSSSQGGSDNGGNGSGMIASSAAGLLTQGGAVGTRANPVIVEVSAGRTGMIVNVIRLVGLGIFVAFVYQTLNGKQLPSPLAQLTGDMSEEVTDIPTTRFSDVKGVDEAKGELQDVVAFLRDPERFKRLGAKVPRGVLLTGPPGTGKTLLARAVAGEAGCKFYSRSASEFEEMLVGLGAKRVRELFNAAGKNAPAIIFIDEIDALGGKRKVSIGGGSERQTLNQLLSSMDGFTKNENVIVIAATNSPDILDPALTRPGRFDSTVDVPLPDVKGRKEIIDLYLTKVVAARAIDSELLAKATPGFSGAQLEALVNSAALMAAHRGAEQVYMSDFEEARDKLIMGPAKKSRVRRPEAMKLTAYHEGGHTLTALLTKGTDPLHKVTILPRGFSGGATYSLPKDDELATRESILAQIDVCMGGRAAEEIVYGPDKITTGAGMDMSQASDLARRFCSLYSMSELGLSSFGNTEPSSDRKAAIDVEVEKILRMSYMRVVNLMQGHRSELDRLATALLEHETLSADECRDVVSGKAIPSLAEKIAATKKLNELKSSSSSSSSQRTSAGGSSSSGHGGSGIEKGNNGGLDKPASKGIWAFKELVYQDEKDEGESLK